MPLLPANPAHPTPYDQQIVFDALCFMQAPTNLNRLGELLAEQRTARGKSFSAATLRGWLSELLLAKQVVCNSQGQWWAVPELAWPRFAALVQQPDARARWWAAWRRLVHFDSSWHLELFGDDAMLGALRVVVFAGGTPDAYDRLCKLSRSSWPQQPALLTAALLRPFEPALWDRLNPDLRYLLLVLLLKQMGGDNESFTTPLWTWLLAQSQPDPGQLQELPRLKLAERLLLTGQRDESRRVLLAWTMRKPRRSALPPTLPTATTPTAPPPSSWPGKSKRPSAAGASSCSPSPPLGSICWP